MDEKTLEGIIIKGIGGFYYVEAANQTFCCKARGLLRKQKITPLAGDRVIISINRAGENTVDEILPRSNFLLRPPIANAGRLIIVSSVVTPKPVPYLIDRLTVIAVNKGIEPVVVFSKSDLSDTSQYTRMYKNVGIPVFSVSTVTHEGKEKLIKVISDKINVFTGNSGVGKSSLLNILSLDINLKTGEISQKLGRGRHTTREVELFKFREGYIADTPGFSALETQGAEAIPKENLQFCFPEFLPLLGKCKFSSCTHTGDLGCVIAQAAERGDISKSRFESYKAMYKQAKNTEDWSE
ncbi:MAG: putative ribosome biogenesis GTPase RsgA [Firmicutes bacterium ADurb.Bin300]|nr:MAG: putative ribosome biogenesis GTPase RsgA [Firmicutes bacterium ADurb.Bin300]